MQEGEIEMARQLFFMNLPYNCSDRELKEWIESRGFKTGSIRIIRDLVAGVSPAFGYAVLIDDAQIGEAVIALDGKKMRIEDPNSRGSQGR